MITVAKYKTLIDLTSVFPSERDCHQYLASQRWETGEVVCPHSGCGHTKYYVFQDGIRYKCKKCSLLFTAKTNTFMEGSKLPSIKWLFAMYLILHKKGISSVQLSKDIGVTQKTAWFVLQRVRWALKNDSEDGDKLEGIVELDESYVGGKNKNRHADKKVKNSQGRAYKDKTPVFGMLQRDGRLKALSISQTSGKVLRPLIYKNIKQGSVLMCDEFNVYKSLDINFERQIVNHGKGQYVAGDCYTNGLENFWSHMKRGLMGVYIQVSRKHLDKYVHEFVFKHNYRSLNMQGQIEAIIASMNCRLKYKDLIA